jgi:hypothetical protein
MYGCDTWILTIRKEHRSWGLENRELRRIFEPNTEKVTGDWRRLHAERLHKLYGSSNIIRVIKSRE